MIFVLTDAWRQSAQLPRSSDDQETAHVRRFFCREVAISLEKRPIFDVFGVATGHFFIERLGFARFQAVLWGRMRRMRRRTISTGRSKPMRGHAWSLRSRVFHAVRSIPKPFEAYLSVFVSSRAPLTSSSLGRLRPGTSRGGSAGSMRTPGCPASPRGCAAPAGAHKGAKSVPRGSFLVNLMSVLMPLREFGLFMGLCVSPKRCGGEDLF